MILCTLEGIDIIQDADGRVHFVADAAIDADGSPRAYNPQNTGLDDLRNARDGHGGWCGIVTDAAGRPVLQTANQPAPGYYISPTAWQDPRFNASDPRRYLDSEKIPFIVIENFIRRRARGIVLGCRALLTNLETKQSVWAMVGDLGPLYKIGEISIAAAQAIGVPSSARTGGTSKNIIQYEFWPGIPAIIASETYSLIPSTS